MTNLEKKLNQYVADLAVMYTKLHNAHWYVQGPIFPQVHVLFEGYYDQVTMDMDSVAERMLQIGFKPVANLKNVLAITKIEEMAEGFAKDLDLIKIVKTDFEHLLKLTLETKEEAEKAKDDATVDLMNGFTAYYQKALWMLNSTLAK